VDYWSIGTIMFECLVGHPPFYSDTPQETYMKILRFKEFFVLPSDIHLSPAAIHLMSR
jgi:protein-serine/threonine kinase